MSELSVRFTGKRNGYNREEVDQFVKDVESMLQERAATIAGLQQQIANLEARLQKMTGDDATVEEKVELYDKLMKKMDGDYTNLLAPAIAKAKKIEAKAEEEYAVRIDQARYTAEGIYRETADRIAAAVDDNVDRLYGLLDSYIYSQSLPGKIDSFFDSCQVVSQRIARRARKMSKLPAKAQKKVQKTYSGAANAVKKKANTYRNNIVAYKEAD
ncbi:MAG: DivIVA domain-containing protein [Ruminococcaceae bacterium]|nr:DivIVA domain-containing protein [Oscillospiraceae bacterium]